MKPTPITSLAPEVRASAMERIVRSTTVDARGCWIWTRTLDGWGYGKFHIRHDGRRRQTGSHRAAWLAFRGDIGDGLQIDHLCRVRSCANPWHMETVTPAVNSQRAEMKGRVGRKRETYTGCRVHGFSNGHLVTNHQNGGRRWWCRPCAKRRTDAHRARASAAKG